MQGINDPLHPIKSWQYGNGDEADFVRFCDFACCVMTATDTVVTFPPIGVPVQVKLHRDIFITEDQYCKFFEDSTSSGCYEVLCFAPVKNTGVMLVRC